MVRRRRHSNGLKFVRLSFVPFPIRMMSIVDMRAERAVAPR